VNEFFTSPSYFEKATLLTPSELLNEFEAHVVEKAGEVAADEQRVRPDWFTEAEHLLVDLIDKRNEAYKNFMKRPSEENHIKLREVRHNLLREKRKAQRSWQHTFALNCQKKQL
jgi:alpha-galactosidase/6-phospho-beta-glucosidase family protein